jgi:acyl transferase domain-containing protein
LCVARRYVRAEGAGVLVMTAAAASGGSAVNGSSGGGFVALVVGAAVNQDGRSSALTAPNGPAQQEVMRSALRGVGDGGARPGLAPSAVVALSMHGTGTPLGDPIEVGAAAAVLQPRGAAAGAAAPIAPLTLSSSKSWFGHAEPAAGMLGEWTYRVSTVCFSPPNGSRPV